MEYSIDVIQEVMANINNYLSLGIDYENLFNFSKKEKEMISRILNIYTKTVIYRDIKTVELKEYNTKEITKLSNEMLSDIFPNRKREIYGLDKLIVHCDIEKFESYVGYIVRGKEIEIKKIEMPKNYNLYTIATLAHEKMHILAFRKIDGKTLLSGNLEILPFIVEKIILHELDNEYLSLLENIFRINEARHIRRRLEDIKQLKKENNLTELDKYVYSYFKIKEYSYFLAEVYSELLLLDYVKDRNRVIEDLNKILDGKITINDFLLKYNINLLRKEIPNIANEKQKKVKRIAIIP